MTVHTSSIRTTNPTTEAELATYDEFSPDEIERALADAHDAQRSWRTIALDERARIVTAMASILRDRHEEYANLITAEMGKPLAESRAEVEKCAVTCDYFAAHGATFLDDREIPTQAHASYVTYEPLGVVLAIMPWNFPFFQVVRFCAPALIAGNAALLKHSPNTTGCALAIEQALSQAGLPDGVFRALLISEESVAEVTEQILSDPRVAAVTLTGSERAGTAVGAAAGRALKKTVLELGGSDPFIVLDDADVQTAARQAARARFFNAGQSCISAKRFIVATTIAEEFEEAFAEAAAAIVVGDPLDPETGIGPLAREDLLNTLDRQVLDSVALGAKIRLGGHRIDRDGYFYEPTILTDVTPAMRVFREETFGPVAAVIKAADDQHAIELANDTQYGLAASVWTRDIERGRRVGRQVHSGALFVNAVVASDPRLPFGGIKRSGYGRELAAEGIREFVNARTVWIEAAL